MRTSVVEPAILVISLFFQSKVLRRSSLPTSAYNSALVALLLAVPCLFVTAKDAFADARADIAAGDQAYKRGQSGLGEAIRFYTRAIDSGELSGANLGFAHEKRGSAMFHKRLYEDALDEFAIAIRLEPRSAGARASHGDTAFVLGRWEEAIQDYDGALELDESLAYAVLWRYLAQLAVGKDAASDLAAAATRIDHAKWPAPVIDFYLGKTTPDEFLAAASGKDPCDEVFYVAEYQLRHGKRAEAEAMFRRAVQSCPHGNPGFSNEYDAAQAELKRLGK